MQSLHPPFEKEDMIILLEAYKIRIASKETERDAAKATYEQAEKEITALQMKIKSIESRISEMVPSKEVGSEFDNLTTWNERVTFILNENKGGLTPSEVVDKLLVYMPNWDRGKLAASIYPTISAKINKLYKKVGDKVILK